MEPTWSACLLLFDVSRLGISKRLRDQYPRSICCGSLLCFSLNNLSVKLLACVTDVLSFPPNEETIAIKQPTSVSVLFVMIIFYC